MRTLLHLAEIDSTQAFLRRHPELDSCAVVADRQTEGRGRQGNRWISEAGAGLWMSAAIPPPDLPPGLVLQRAMGAVAACLESSGAELGLKWPNDLVARKDGRIVKLGGILGERTGERLILGLGVNLRSSPPLEARAFPASSLAELGALVPERMDLARRILEAWQHLEDDSSPAFRWPEAGAAIQWQEGQGVVLDWEPDGRLKVTGAAGIQRLSAADIRGMAPASR